LWAPRVAATRPGYDIRTDFYPQGHSRHECPCLFSPARALLIFAQGLDKTGKSG
jgi:hypothetical protein